MRAIVIGSGFGGIAIALRLRAKGYEVTIIDRTSKLGGRAQVFERNGYRHDAGPTVITAPFLFEELFELFDEKMADHINLVPIKPWYRFYFSDKSSFDYGGSLEETISEIRKIEPKDVKGYIALLKHSKRIFDLAFLKLSAKPFHRMRTMLRYIPAMISLRSYQTVWRLVCSKLSHDKLRRAFSIQPLLVGGNPFNTSSIYSLIHYLEYAYGVHFAMGGTGAILSALEKLLNKNGVRIRLETSVKNILTQDKLVTGVSLANGETIEADLVVFNGDPTYFYQNMLCQKQVPLSVKAKLAISSYSMGLFVLYFGTSRTYPEVAHHTIWMGERYQELLKDIFDKKILADDFSLYIHRPTATDPSFAPKGCDSFYVLCPVPNLQSDTDWSIQGEKLKNRIVKALGETMLPGLSECMVEDFYMTPDNFKTDYLSTHGAGFSIAPLFRQSAWFRFHNQDPNIKNLFFVGAGTHPGAGLPGVLCSAKVVDTFIEKQLVDNG